MKKDIPTVQIKKKKSKILLVLEIVVVFTIYTAILIFLRNHIPNAPSIVSKIEMLYGSYGYELIFLGALLEGTFMVGFYVPGSFIVLLGAALARRGVVSFPLVILFGTFGLTAGYLVSYLLGRFGWFRIIEGFGLDKNIKDAEKKLLKHQDKALFFCYMMPSTASFLSTAAGILKIDLKKFILKSLGMQLFWSLLWGGLAYTFGMRFVEAFIAYFGFIALAGFLLVVVKKLRWK